MFENSEFERIVREYAKPLFKYCYARTHNKELTEETLNDVFEVLFIKWDSLSIDSNIRAYLYRVADNCIKHNLKKYNDYYEKTTSLDRLVESNGLIDESIDDEYFKPIATTEQQIKQVYEKLDEESRVLFECRYISELTLNEISDKLNMPYSTLRYKLFKLEKLIKQIISNIFQDFSI